VEAVADSLAACRSLGVERGGRQPEERYGNQFCDTVYSGGSAEVEFVCIHPISSLSRFSFQPLLRFRVVAPPRRTPRSRRRWWRPWNRASRWRPRAGSWRQKRHQSLWLP